MESRRLTTCTEPKKPKPKIFRAVEADGDEFLVQIFLHSAFQASNNNQDAIRRTKRCSQVGLALLLLLRSSQWTDLYSPYSVEMFADIGVSVAVLVLSYSTLCRHIVHCNSSTELRSQSHKTFLE